MPFLIPFIPAIIAGISVAGTGVSVYGQRQAASAAEATAKYNSQIQRNQSKQEMQVGAENARRKTRENARILGLQRAAVAQSGLAMEGTPLAILGESAMTLQRDILDIGFDAGNKARTLNAAAAMSIYNGKQQASALRTESIATGLSGVASAASGYGKAQGLFPAGATTIEY